MSNEQFGLDVPKKEQLQPLKKPLKPKKIGTLPPEQRKWANNVLQALGLKSTASQGRMLAGAIASATIVEQDVNAHPKDKQLALELRERVIKAGNPPWAKPEIGMLVGASKVHLDLLTIPQKDRRAKPLDPSKKGVNQAFWIDRTDPDGQQRHAFLCKPANHESLQDPASGGPRGGEVAREAMAGCAAQWLASETGIDIGMPETHVVKLDGGLMGQQSGQTLTCSIQEFSKTEGDLRTNPGRKLDPGQIAGIAIFDALTLNTDRHPGNILLDEKGNMVPIDHGESFAEPNETGLARVKATLGSPHNALLALPGAHEPMSTDLCKRLRSMDPDSYAKSLHLGNQAIGLEHKDMAKAVSPGAVESARRAAWFTCQAAKCNPPMSPAAIQIALGNSADLLLAEDVPAKEFERNALLVIKRFANQGDTLKEVCLAPNTEYEELVRRVEALGWVCAKRAGAPSPGALADPLTMLAIVKHNVKPTGKNILAQAKQLNQIAMQQPISPQEAMGEVYANRASAIRRMILVANPKDTQKFTTEVNKPPKQEYDTATQLLSLARLLEVVTKSAIVFQTDRLDTLDRQNLLEAIVRLKLLEKDVTTYTAARGYLAAGEPHNASPLIDQMTQTATQGMYIPLACTTAVKRLNRSADVLGLPRTNHYLKQGLQAAASNDPVKANVCWMRMKADAKEGKVVERALGEIRKRVETICSQYVIEGKDEFLVKVLLALDEGDPDVVLVAWEMLLGRVFGSSYAPGEDYMRTLAIAMRVPLEDGDLKQALHDAHSGNAGALKAWNLVRTRSAKGEFGDEALKDVQRQLGTLIEVWNVPKDYPTLVDAETAIKDRNVPKAQYLIDRLAQQGKASLFEMR